MIRRMRRPVGIHPLIAAGIARQAKEHLAAEIARPMREMFRELLTGDITEVPVENGDLVTWVAAMRMPEVDPLFRVPGTEWVDVAQGISSWVDSIGRLVPRLRTDKMKYLAERLTQDKSATERMVEQASAQFEAFVSLIPGLPDGALKSNLMTVQIALEFEKINTKETT